MHQQEIMHEVCGHCHYPMKHHASLLFSHLISKNYVAHAALVKTRKADMSRKAAPAEWLSEVSEPVKGVMSAMQQMASVAVQANEQKDSSHARLVQSMTPDALLACGECLHQAAVPSHVALLLHRRMIQHQ